MQIGGARECVCPLVATYSHVAVQVYQGICKSNGEKVAIKKLDLDDMGWGAHWVCSLASTTPFVAKVVSDVAHTAKTRSIASCLTRLQRVRSCGTDPARAAGLLAAQALGHAVSKRVSRESAPPEGANDSYTENTNCSNP